MINYHDVFGGQVSKGYIAPLPIGILKKKSVTAATIFNGLEPIDIFDSFIGNFKNLGIKLAGFGMKKLALGSFLYELEHSGRPFDAAKEMYTSATSNTLSFAPINGSAIPIYSPSSYEQGSTISHVRKSLESSEDFIMIPGVSAGISLANTMSKINVNNVYGRGILSVLESIGWNTNPGQPQKNVELALDYQGEIPAAIGGGTLLFPHLWILLLFMLVI